MRCSGGIPWVAWWEGKIPLSQFSGVALFQLVAWWEGKQSLCLDSQASRCFNSYDCVQKAFLNFVVTPTWDLLKDIAPKSHSLAKSIIARNFTRWAALAEHGDPTAVLHDNDPHMPSGRVHISPIQSPFHSNNQTSWCGSPPT
jgi:hypothetical protein